MKCDGIFIVNYTFNEILTSYYLAIRELLGLWLSSYFLFSRLHESSLPT